MGKNNLADSDTRLGRCTKSRSIKLLILAILSVLFLISLTGCVTFADPEASQDFTADNVGTLSSDATIGQSFISRRSHFNGITIWISRTPSLSGSEGSNNLSFQLFSVPGDKEPFFAGSITVPATGTHLPVNLTIPDQKNPAGQSYFIRFANDTDTIQFNGRNADAYPNGTTYINDQPINADIAFRLSYEYGFSSFIEDIHTSLASLWIVLPLVIVLWLPGWLLLDFSGLRPSYDLGEQIALAMGLSLAFIPIAMLWTTVLRLKATGQSTYFVAGLLIALFLVRLVYKVVKSSQKPAHSDVTQPGNSIQLSVGKDRLPSFQFLALLLIFFASLIMRLIMVRDLATPAWVDSVHHAFITRLILGAGAYPSSYLPYMDISPNAYHLGFHSIAAIFTWLSQLDLSRSLLILGQLLNALSVFSVYLFTKTLTQNTNSGLFAAVITGFLTPMPTYYTSWGRYTELTGLLLLPVILALIQPWMKGNTTQRSYWIVLLGAITAGGLFMIHYRVLAFLACLLFTYVVLNVIKVTEANHPKPVRLFLVILSMVIVTMIIVLPWLIPTVKSNLLPYVTTTISSSVPFFQDFAWPYLTSAFGKQSLVLAGLGLIWGIIKPRRFTFILLVWITLLFLLANLAALKLPGGGLVNNSSVEIMLFIPISILGGYFLAQLLAHWKEMMPGWLLQTSFAIVLVLTAIISYLGARQLVTILNPVTILSRNGDLGGIKWVKDNIPLNETIVINPFAWGYGLYAGNDGGFWITPLTGRQTLPPPVLYGLSSDAKAISQLSQQVISLSSDPGVFRDFLLSHQLHYVYLGVRGGAISPEKLSSSGLFSLLYHQDGVWVFSPKP